MTRYAIGLGSNLGDRLGHMVEAASALEERLGPLLVSSLYETEPVGGPEQGPFLNAIAVVETDSSPLEVLDVLQEVERSRERQRSVRWGPRTLDLDLVAGPAVSSERLVVPHPRAVEREFVLRPLAEVWPDAEVGDGLVASEALAGLGSQGVDRLVTDWRPPRSRAKATALLAAQGLLLGVFALVVLVDGAWPASWPKAVAGSVLAAGGVAVALWASSSLGSALTASPIPREDAPLVVVGPYRHVRHPIYGGLVLLLTGVAVLTGSLLAFPVVVATVALFVVKARYEESQLRMRHSGYRGYMEAVRRRLIPFVI